MHRLLALASLSALFAAAGCDCEGQPRPTPCTSQDDCAAGELCIDRECVAIPDGGLDAGRRDDAPGTCAAENTCGTSCCDTGDRCALETCIEAIQRGSNIPQREGETLECDLFGLAASTDDMREGMAAFLEKRKPAFKGR